MKLGILFALLGTLVIYGGAYAASPNAKLVEVADSYHFIMLDQPGRFAGEVKAFLEK